jgi:hypothetical protein
VHGLIKSHRGLVLQLVADVLSVTCTDMLHEFLPRRSDLVRGRLLAVIKHVGTKSGVEPFLESASGARVVLAASATAVAASTATTVSSSSSAHPWIAYRRYGRA